MIRWLRSRRYARCRRLDLELLWPICRGMAPDLDHARAVFAQHAFNDDAWIFLGHETVSNIIMDLA